MSYAVYQSPGTISISGTALTGSGTTFEASGLKAPCIIFAGNGESAIGLSIDSDTGITLAESWAGASVSGSSAYAILSIDAAYALLKLNELLDTISTNLASMLMGTGTAVEDEADVVGGAGAVDVGGAASWIVAISGTSGTITSFSNMTNKIRFGRFTQAGLVLQHGASLSLPGGLNITVAAGDRFIAFGDEASNVRLVYQWAADPIVPGVGLNGAAGITRYIDAFTAGSRRARLNMANTTAETGANAGSNGSLDAFSDAAAFLGQVFSWNRATQVVTFPQKPVVPAESFALSKLVNATAQYRYVARTTAGAGSWEEVVMTSLGAAFLAASGGGAMLTAMGLRTAMGAIADDGVGSFSPGGTSALVFIFPNSPTRPSFIIPARLAATPALAPGLVFDLASGLGLTPGVGTVDLTVGTLSGTTGVDGAVTVRIDSDGTIYVENRHSAVTSYTACWWPLG